MSAEQARFHTHSTFSSVCAFSDYYFQHFSFHTQPSCNLLHHSKTLDLYIASVPYASENNPHVSLALFPNFMENLCSEFWLPVFWWAVHWRTSYFGQSCDRTDRTVSKLQPAQVKWSEHSQIWYDAKSFQELNGPHLICWLQNLESKFYLD